MNWMNCYGSLGGRTGNYCIHFPCSFTIFSNVIPASTYGRKLWVWELAQVWKLGKGSWLSYWRSDVSLLLTHLWSLWSYKLRIILIWLSICFPLGALCFISIFIDPFESGHSVLTAHHGNYAFLASEGWLSAALRLLLFWDPAISLKERMSSVASFLLSALALLEGNQSPVSCLDMQVSTESLLSEDSACSAGLSQIKCNFFTEGFLNVFYVRVECEFSPIVDNILSKKST